VPNAGISVLPAGAIEVHRVLEALVERKKRQREERFL
jgi:hypothetical protein